MLDVHTDVDTHVPLLVPRQPNSTLLFLSIDNLSELIGHTIPAWLVKRDRYSLSIWGLQSQSFLPTRNWQLEIGNQEQT